MSGVNSLLDAWFSFQLCFGVTNLYICCHAEGKLLTNIMYKNIFHFSNCGTLSCWDTELFHQIQQPSTLVILKELQNTEHHRLHMEVASASSLH